ncbi:MAG: ATP-binding protein [Gammaproteobacteria bacterium]|nr:ATP-binding protein [Gammaproteobacteria bacterium]
MQRLQRIHFLSRADQLQPVRDAVRNLARQQGCSDDNLDCMVMAINEACMNVIQHAYHQVDDGEIILEFWQDSGDLVIRIYDFAEPVDRNSIRSRDLDDIRPGGLGVHLIHKVMDQIDYLDGPDGIGNLLEMRKTLGGQKQCRLKNNQEQ